MNPDSFRKESIGAFPFASLRDCTICTAMIVLVATLAGFLTLRGTPDYRLFSVILIGAYAGMLPSMLMCLPVRGKIARLSKSAFLGKIANLKFVSTQSPDGRLIYTYESPRWARWDSNRVVLEETPDGDVQATVPLYVFRILKRT